MTVPESTSGGVEATTALLQAELPRLEEQQQALEKDLASVTARLTSVRSALTALQALSEVPPVLNGAAPQVPDEVEPQHVASVEAEDATVVSVVTAPEEAPDAADAPAADAVKAEAAPAPASARKTPTKRSTTETSPRARKQRSAKKTSAAPDKAVKADKPAKAAKAVKEVKPARARKATSPAASAPAAPDGGSLTEQVMEVVAAAGGKALRARDVTEALGRELTAGSINTVRGTLDRLVATSRAHRAGRGLYQAPGK